MAVTWCPAPRSRHSSACASRAAPANTSRMRRGPPTPAPALSSVPASGSLDAPLGPASAAAPGSQACLKQRVGGAEVGLGPFGGRIQQERSHALRNPHLRAHHYPNGLVGRGSPRPCRTEPNRSDWGAVL
eukprot:1448025-Prymnesium_polylepis.1